MTERLQRWCRPYQSGNEWAVTLRYRPSTSQLAYGLKERLVADSLEELSERMAAQDELYREYMSPERKGAPAWSHRNSGA